MIFQIFCCCFCFGVFLVLLLFWPRLAAYGILVPGPGIEPVPLQWKRGVLTTGPPEKSSNHFFNPAFFFFNLVLPALGLRCCVWAFSSCSKRGLFLVVVCGLLIAVASLVAEQHVGSSQTRAQTRVPCIGRRILNHCTTREVPLIQLLKTSCGRSHSTQANAELIVLEIELSVHF